MKAFYLSLIFSAVLLQSCNSYTYIAQMPNVPMFEKAGQAQAAGGLALNHAEGQASVSISRYLGASLNVFKGKGGTYSTELGLLSFIRLNRMLQVSMLCGLRQGEINFRGEADVLYMNTIHREKSEFTGYYGQAAFNIGKKDARKVFFLSCKYARDKYRNYIYQKNSHFLSGFDSISQYGSNLRYAVVTPFFGLRKKLSELSPGISVYYMFQVGLNLPLNKITVLQQYFDDSSGGTGLLSQPTLAPLHNILVLNFAIGLSLNSIKNLF